MVHFSFYKAVLFTCQLAFAFFSNFSAISVFDSIFMVLYNVSFLNNVYQNVLNCWLKYFLKLFSFCAKSALAPSEINHAPSWKNQCKHRNSNSSHKELSESVQTSPIALLGKPWELVEKGIKLMHLPRGCPHITIIQGKFSPNPF